MSSPILEGSSGSANEYNRALSTAYSSWSVLYDQSYALQRDPEVWEKTQRDSTIAQATSTRLQMICGREWFCEPGADDDASKEAASICDQVIRNIRGFQESRIQLASACFRGTSYAYVEGRTETQTIGDGVARQWWMPVRLRDVDDRRIRRVPEHYLDAEGRKKIRIRQQMWSVLREEYEDLSPDYLKQFVKLIYRNEESRLGSGRGILDSLYFLYWAKGQTWRLGLQGLNRWSSGMIIGKINADREGSTGRTNDAIRDELFDSLEAMRAQNILVCSTDEEVTLLESSGSGHQQVFDFIRYIDERILSLILGSVLPFGAATETGSLARATVEAETTNAIVMADRELLDEALGDLIELVWAQNWQNLVALGLGSATIPVFRTDLAVRQDPAQAVQIITALGAAGVPLKLSEIYRRTGFSAPGPDDEAFLPTPQPAAAPGMPFSQEPGQEWIQT